MEALVKSFSWTKNNTDSISRGGESGPPTLKSTGGVLKGEMSSSDGKWLSGVGDEMW